MVLFAFSEGANGIQITGGSTFDDKKELGYIISYLEKLKDINKENLLLYITPPKDYSLLDKYFALGATQIACSLEIWDEKLAKTVTPGKILYTGREHTLKTLEHISQKFGPSKAFSNFIIGIEPVESLKKGALYLAQRGIIPTASVWMPVGRPVLNSMKAPCVDYYKEVKEYFAELYSKYSLTPAKSTGLNVCIERDIYNYSKKH